MKYNVLYQEIIVFGNSQKPEISDYPDGIDTISFIVNYIGMHQYLGAIFLKLHFYQHQNKFI